ncbi:uncharacterized protein [Palaemon carinicauda]|uniref:uncharacterized protein n=1 Tax=Palaemon carinicauda TaxID=392227 RepID=UPI0035B65505
MNNYRIQNNSQVKPTQASTKEGKVPSYYFDKGVLFRLYQPRKLSANDTWANKEQLVVPLTLRKIILSVAHQADSHLGVSKTHKRIANDFFWPGMKHDVFEFVKECHICQVVGKPNEVIPKAHLIPIVIPHEPFSKVIIDCVGPLPKTKKGNQYILTILCPTTRYPIAIPLGNICARNIVKNLLKVFTTYGFPKEIQSDRGTNFTSDLFNETLREFIIKHILASPYHPQSQGALERHHQTLKSLLRKFCMETGTDWDESLDLILFVIKEVPNDSLGMSPFEMLFGHKVRGPLQVLKDKMLNNDTLDNVTVGHTPDRRKSTQLGHVYLIKKYHGNPPVALHCPLDTNVLDSKKYNAPAHQSKTPLPHDVDLYHSNDIVSWTDSANQEIVQNIPIDLLRGYYQIPLTDRAKLISAFITPFGLFQYERLPFGLTNAPAIFQRLVNSVIQDLDGTYVYIDDIVVTSDTLDEHIHRLTALFGHLQEFGLTIPLAKSSFGKGKVRYLGHITGSGEITPKDENTTTIVEFPVPRNRKSLLRFLGMTSYYRKFCKNYSTVATPLIDLPSPKNKFVWSSNCQQAFDQLKNILCSNPVLIAPDLALAKKLRNTSFTCASCSTTCNKTAL